MCMIFNSFLHANYYNYLLRGLWTIYRFVFVLENNLFIFCYQYGRLFLFINYKSFLARSADNLCKQFLYSDQD